MNPKYPVYIISKGRWKSRLTSKALEKMGVPYRIVIEAQEFEQYSAVIDREKIIVLPFSNLGLGGIPARNFVFEHSIKEGHEKHWIMDDNIRAFRRYNDDKKYLVTSGTIFKCAEDFVERYDNIGMSGFQYSSFMAYNRQKRPFTLNCRIYSCILINNSIPHRWEGRYNEDSDLSIRCLKSGWCTILFNSFLQDKTATMTMKGGNTDTIYNTNDNRREFAESLKRKHPDCVEVIWRFNRWHHLIQYNKILRPSLIKRKDFPNYKGIDEYGMVLTNLAAKGGNPSV